MEKRFVRQFQIRTKRRDRNMQSRIHRGKNATGMNPNKFKTIEEFSTKPGLVELRVLSILVTSFSVSLANVVALFWGYL
jgi:hypothetical protein